MSCAARAVPAGALAGWRTPATTGGERLGFPAHTRCRSARLSGDSTRVTTSFLVHRRGVATASLDAGTGGGATRECSQRSLWSHETTLSSRDVAARAVTDPQGVRGAEDEPSNGGDEDASEDDGRRDDSRRPGRRATSASPQRRRSASSDAEYRARAVMYGRERERRNAPGPRDERDVEYRASAKNASSDDLPRHGERFRDSSGFASAPRVSRRDRRRARARDGDDGDEGVSTPRGGVLRNANETRAQNSAAGAIVSRFQSALARGHLEKCVSTLEACHSSEERRNVHRRVARALAPHHKSFLTKCSESRPPRTDLARRYAVTFVAPNARLYASALTTCARAGDFANATKVFALYGERGVPPDVFAYSGIVSAAGKANDLNSARRFLNLAVQDLGDACDVGVYNAFVDACARAGDVRAARETCAAMKARGTPACLPNARTYNSVITAAARARDLPAAKAALAEMERDRPRVAPTDRTFGAALAAAAAEETPRAESVRWALETYERFVSDPEFSGTYARNNHAASSVLTVLARGVAANAWPAEDAVRRAGEITGALVSLGSVDSKTEKTETRRAPNAAVWSAHMSVCARAGRAREALDALALMRECGVALDAYTLASALTACRGQPRERRGDWRGDEDDAEASEEVFSGESDAEDGHERGGGPSGASFAAASPEALEALEAFETAPASVSGTVAVRNAAIALYAAAGRADRAFALYESMRASPRGAGDAEPGRRASRGDGGDGDDDENRSGARARALPEDAASSPDTITYNTLISACASSDAPARAEELHRDMVAAGVPRSGRTYVGLMTAAARAADPGEGAAAAARVFALAEADETTEPANAFTYTALIDAQVKGRDPDAAFATFERMKSAGVAPTVVTFGCLLNACRAEFMNTPRASRREALGEDLPALPSMKNASSSESHAASDAEKETRFFDANSARSHIAVSRAYDLLSQMSRFGVCPNDRCQNALVRVVSEAGRVDDALDEVKKIARGGGRFERATLEGVVLALCREGYAERALRIVGWMDVRGYAPGPAAYRALVRACSIEGSVTTAWRVHSDGRAKISYRPDRAAASALILALSRAALAVDPSDARVMTRRAMGVFDDATREGIAREWGEDDNVPELSPNAADAESSVGDVARGDAPAGQFCPVRLLDASPRAFLFAGDAVMSSPDAILTPAAARALVAAAARCGELRFAMSLFRSEGGQSALRLRVSSEEDDRRAALEALIETCCHEGDADGALEVFDVVKSFDIPVGKVTLAFLENFCRRSRVPEWRVFDVCAQMRAQSEKKKQQSLRYSNGATAKKKSHHVFGSVSSELRDFGLGVGRGDDA